jgi:hypothetical protein
MSARVHRILVGEEAIGDDNDDVERRLCPGHARGDKRHGENVGVEVGVIGGPVTASWRLDKIRDLHDCVW